MFGQDEYALDEAPVVQTIQTTAEDRDVQIEIQETIIGGQAPPPAAIPASPPIPQLYDMDLERIHDELYKDRYLVPQHFLNDLQKIVHNAEVYEEEDRERLRRAQAMFTAAQVSIQELEPHFRMECEKMAKREMKRREDEQKEDKDDAQSKSKDIEPEMFSRRVSNPIHGVKRKLSDVQLDGLDTASWDAKRARMLGEVDADADSDDDPLDTLGAPGMPSAGPPRLQPPSGSMTNGYGGTPHPSNVNSLLNPTSPNPSLNVYSPTPCNSQSLHRQPSPGPSQQSTSFSSQHAAPSSFASGSRNSRPLDMWSPPQKQPWSLLPQPQLSVQDHLNEMSGQWPHRSDSQHNPNTIDDQWSIREEPQRYPDTMGDQPHRANDGGPQPQQQPPPQFVHLRRTLSIPDHVFGPHQSVRPPRTPSPPRKPEDPIMELPEPQPGSSAMVVDEAEPEPEPKAASPLPPPRTPTPLPDFHVDEDLLTELRDSLRTSTFSLNVEQLEQLRAMCLGAVWRKRAEWDRDGLLRELLDVVRTFVRDVKEEDEEDEEM